MSANTVKVFKFFWADQDEAQEIWLRDMASKGLHLKSLNIFCRWTFEKGEPADVAYRVDFPGKQDVHFNQLLQDAGWESAVELAGWQYWRKPVEAGVAHEIFTDDASKVQKFKTLLVTLFLLTLPLFLLLTSGNQERFLSQVSAPLRWILTGFFALYVPFILYAILRLWRRISASAAPR